VDSRAECHLAFDCVSVLAFGIGMVWRFLLIEDLLFLDDDGFHLVEMRLRDIHVYMSNICLDATDKPQSVT
jgi:hypothetical protein